jgi:death-on-curing family protein
MTRNALTVELLAREAGIEVDDALIKLWDAGVEYPSGPKSPIRAQDVARARDSCDLANGRELTRVDYWLQRDGVSREAFAERLAALGIRLGPNARALPKGAVAKLRRSTPAARPVVRNLPVAKQPTSTPFVWRNVGHVRETKFLEVEEIESIHFALADDFAGTSDPVSPAGVREPDLLASAATRPRTSLGGEAKYKTVELASAALMHSLVHNHAFYNGNKRTALVAMLTMLDRNGVVITSTQDELFKWTIRVAQHRVGKKGMVGDKSDIEVTAMAEWICSNSRLLDRGEKVLAWHYLKRRLLALGCEVVPTGTRGGAQRISRIVQVRDRNFLGVPRMIDKRLSIQVAYDGDGRDVSKSDIRSIRRDLHLDDEHGVDSAIFYGTDSTPPDLFIAEYRKTLVRLAKM